MPSTFALAAVAALAAVRITAGVAVAYKRGDGEPIAIPDAVPSQASVSVMDPLNRVAIETSVRDYLIAAARLASLTPPEPRDGDLIEETDVAGVVRTYEVLSPGGDEPAWRWSDPDRSTARVHTKLIAEEVTP